MTGRRFLPVDRRNAVAWLSRGIITPRAAMSKYRSDFLESAPNLLPLASDAAVGAISSNARFPVALEVDASVADRLNRSDEASPVLWFPGAIPTSRIVGIHVPSTVDLEELLARAYQGFSWTPLEAEVNPELFEVSSTEQPPPPAVSVPDDRRLRRREAIAGALISAASVELIEQFLIVQLDNTEVDEFALLVDTVVSLGLLEGGDDRALLAAALDCIFEQTEAGDLVPSLLVEQLADRAASAGDRRLAPYFTRILQLLHGEDELRPFQRRGGLLIPKALLLYLLRPDPEAVTQWTDEDLNVEPEVQRLAQLLAGFGTRYAGLSADLRQRCHSKRLLDWTADGLWVTDPSVSEGGSRDRVTPDSRAMNGVDPYRHPLQRGLAAEVRAGDASRALRVTQALHWNDSLIITVVSDSFEVSGRDQQVSVTFAAGAEIVSELVPEPFLARLAATDDVELARALGEHPDP